MKAKVEFTVSCTAIAIGNRHVFIAEASYSPHYPYSFDLMKCGATPDPGRWSSKISADLKAALSLEHAVMQEHDKYVTGPQLGFAVELPEAACIQFVVVVGHYADQPTGASAFYVTARHVQGGPMYCVTMIGGTVAAGATHVSQTGGPILSPQSCAVLRAAPSGPTRHIPP